MLNVTSLAQKKWYYNLSDQISFFKKKKKERKSEKEETEIIWVSDQYGGQPPEVQLLGGQAVGFTLGAVIELILP